MPSAEDDAAPWTGSGRSCPPAAPAPGCGRSRGRRRPKFLHDLAGTGAPCSRRPSTGSARWSGTGCSWSPAPPTRTPYARSCRRSPAIVAEPSPARLDGRDRAGRGPARAGGPRRADRLVRRRPRDHRRRGVPRLRPRGGRGRRHRAAGHDRHRADVARRPASATSARASGSRASRPRRRSPSSWRSPTPRRARALRGVGGVPLERRHVRRPRLGPARPARRAARRPRRRVCARSPRTPPRSRSAGRR